MKDKVSFLKERPELAQKIISLYQTLLNFEKNKNNKVVVINFQKRNEKTNKTVSENTRSS